MFVWCINGNTGHSLRLNGYMQISFFSGCTPSYYNTQGLESQKNGKSNRNITSAGGGGGGSDLGLTTVKSH